VEDSVGVVVPTVQHCWASSAVCRLLSGKSGFAIGSWCELIVYVAIGALFSPASMPAPTREIVALKTQALFIIRQFGGRACLFNLVAAPVLALSRVRGLRTQP